MSTSTLIAHSPKFKSHLTSIDALKNLPMPVALGPHHKPISHAVLVEGILALADPALRQPQAEEEHAALAILHPLRQVP